MPEYDVLASTSENTVVSNYEPVKQKSDAYQSEADLEAEFIRMLQTQGYEYLHIHQEQDLIANVKTQLERLNDIQFTQNEWNSFFSQVLANGSDGIVEKTRKIQEDYVQVLKRDDGSTCNIWLIDKNHPQRNSLQVINQYILGKAEGAKYDNRYDVTILVNGLPLVHVELKRRGVALKEAFNQIERYQRDSFWAGSGLYEYVQIFVISNGTSTKYYSNSTRYKVVRSNSAAANVKEKTSKGFEFTSYWTDAENHVLSDLVDFTRTFLNRHSLLNVLCKYCVFTSEDVLMAMRPYQITACERIINRIEISSNYKTWGTVQGGGYVWHTTGSGKTLTSFKTARLASELPDIDKVLFVVDRKDLDYQTMKEYDRFEKGAANSNTSTAVLTRQLGDSQARIIITTIQKLSEFIKRNAAHPVYKQHVVIIFDECHRSQFGDMHAAIVKAFKKYHIFGFTGTPIMSAHPSNAGNINYLTTEQTFGDRLHAYTIINAIHDKNVLPFHIEYMRTFDEKAGIQDEQIYAIDRDKLFHAPARISAITSYILDHFDQKTYRRDKYYITQMKPSKSVESKSAAVEVEYVKAETSGFNSILAVADVPMAKQYYQEFKRQLANRPDRPLKVATIFSFAANEEVTGDILDEENPENAAQLPAASRDFLEAAIQDYNSMFGTSYDTSSEKFQNYYKDVSLRMKHKEIDLLIVVNMFLTGFDAPSLNTLWVDKNLQLHGLVQAFSRTNRIFNAVKTYGNVVCFRNLQSKVDEALSLYGDTEAGGVVLIHKFNDYYYGFTDMQGKDHQGYYDLVMQFLEQYPGDIRPFSPAMLLLTEDKAQFVRQFSNILRMYNLLLSFDEFAGQEILTPRQTQNYTSVYLDLKDELRPEGKQKTDVSDDLVFEVDLVKSTDMNIDYILYLVNTYHDKNVAETEVIARIENLIKSSPELRSKKELIREFLESMSQSVEITDQWKSYIEQKREEAISALIAEERLKAELARSFILKALETGELVTIGTEIDSFLPPMSRFGGSDRSAVKERVIAKIKELFEKFRNV